jgi:HEAT repeat protein
MVALLALARPKDHRAEQNFRGALTSDYVEVALVAARCMGMLGSDEGYGVALQGARSADPRQRLLAALAFGAIARTDAQEPLKKLLEDSDPDVRVAAANAILQLKPLKVV